MVNFSHRFVQIITNMQPNINLGLVKPSVQTNWVMLGHTLGGGREKYKQEEYLLQWPVFYCLFQFLTAGKQLD